MVTHRESLNAAPELFEALAQNRPGYLKALLYPDGDGGCQAIAAGAPPASSTNRSASSARNGSLGAGPRFRNTSSTKIARRAFKRRLAARKANSIYIYRVPACVKVTKAELPGVGLASCGGSLAAQSARVTLSRSQIQSFHLNQISGSSAEITINAKAH